MTAAPAFVAALERAGVSLVSGVPCSYFAGPIRLLQEHPGIRYVPAVNEGAALAVAAGARLAGEPSVVLAQNSGFGNLVNPLTSLVLPYRIPVLVLVSMRGWPVADPGEPQHHWMGQVVPEWLDSLDVPHWTLRSDGPGFETVLDKALQVLGSGSPAFVLVGKGALADVPGPAVAEAVPDRARPDRDDLVDAVLAELHDEHVLSTTGYLSRALYNRGDRARNFYMQGSMGHVSGIALGTALSRPKERFVVLDGDGAALMHLGTLATVGHHAPGNLVHIVFDNGAYESTGGQPTGSSAVRFDEVARGTGYRHVERVALVDRLRPAIRRALDAVGPALLVVDGRMGGSAGERASNAITVTEITTRFGLGLARAEDSRV
ncbi:phosphonopyruvate decarboxylase [Streptomyces sp. NPDC051909]|uniref:phosphonopyruvate decarboxylase n=1 Tax=Streptomyces sp. NPDC051909 TaxID=3154944 RepID=UPI003413F924